MKKRILGNLLAVGLAAIAVFPLAACKEKPSATEGELLPPDAEEAILPSVPEEPLYFGDIATASPLTGGRCADT